MKRILGLCFVGLLLLSCSGVPEGPGGETAKFERGLGLVKAACFEVVTEKPVKDSLTYDKPLNWDLVNYNIRTDTYIPLGTAFAINSTELVTAAHVLDLGSDSMVIKTRFIREKVKEGGKTVEHVYEIQDIRAFSSNRDYVVFTVKGKTFGTWLVVENAIEFDKKVYTAGDAYGEGIVVREGVLLDEIPEDENGAWNYLKSSIATNPGNSGGPLLNADFKVIGIVLSRKDDFCYSLPMKEIAMGKASAHSRITLGFTVFNKRKNTVFESSWDLPLPYAELTRKYTKEYLDFYYKGMDGLFADNAAELFPLGKNSEKALFNNVDSIFPQIYLQDNTNNAWFSTDLEMSGADIGDDGSVQIAEIYKDAGVWLVRLDKPKSVDVRQMWDNPKTAMDLLLKGIDITRKLTSADQGSRILSYGTPVQSIPMTDRFGRIWRIDVYVLEYSDQIIMTCSTPLPRGLAMIYIARGSSEKDVWLYDMRKIVDYIGVSYSGTLKEWDAFLKQPDFRFGATKDVSMSFTPGSSVNVDFSNASAGIRQGLVDITEDARLFLGCSVFLKNGKPVWDVRKLIVTQGGGSDNYLVLYRWTKPTDSLPDTMKDLWKKNILDQGHPYNGSVFTEEGQTRIGMLHPSFIAGGKAAVPSDYAYTLFGSKEGVVPEADMKRYMKELADGVKIKN